MSTRSIGASVGALVAPVGALRRTLGFLGTVSISVGVMAPTLAMSATGVQPARIIGRAAPLAYVLASLGVGLVAYGFARLAGYVSHAGSVYAFVGRALGPRAGLFTGSALLLTYIVFPPVSMVGMATFGRAFLDSTRIWPDAPWLPLALIGWAVTGLLATRDVRNTTRVLLVLEAFSMLLIAVLVAVIFWKLAAGSAPRGSGLDGRWLHLPPGATFSTVALAATFGFLSFAGFESAGSFGEEANRPRRNIPRSMYFAIALGGVFYVVCMVAQTLGFGTGAAGVHAFASSGAPLGALGRSYVGSWLADALDLGAVLSALGAGLGGVCVASRLLYALGRDGVFPRATAGVARSTGAPVGGLAVSLALSLVQLVAFAAAGASALDTFFYLATIGVLSLLVMYIVTNVGALRFLFVEERRAPLAEAILPVGGIAVAAYTLYRNLWPVPPHPFNLFPYVVAVWLALALAAAWLVPGLARRAQRALASSPSAPQARA
jgi:amino acid transporter